MATSGESGDLRFGRFELRAAQRQLLHDGKPAALGARAFDVLLTLVMQRGRAVTKDELLAAVWPRQVVEENNLTVHVSALRKLLGPDAIATIPGRGYQFTALLSPPAEAAPAAATRPAAAASPTLFGRDDELQRLRAALGQSVPSLITLVGTAGIGKTTLARALAEEATGTPAWWVALEALAAQRGMADTAPLATAVAAAMGLPPAAGPPTDRLLQHLRRQAPTARLALLVLDNCEHLADAAAQLVTLLQAAAPSLRILATSQVPLRLPTEYLVRLEPLDVPVGTGLAFAQRNGAVALFVARAEAVVPGFTLHADNADDVIDICRRLEGIPLALELAAARVPLLGTVGVRERLGERLRLLARAGQPGPTRRQALRAALDWSYDLLPPPEQRLLGRLGIFVGGFTASMAQQLASDAGFDEWAVLDGLNALVEKSLVVAPRGAGANSAEPRFSLLESVRDHARAHVAAGSEAQWLPRKHAELFMALAQAHAGLIGGEHAGARRLRLESEHDNLRAALDWAAQHDPTLGLQMAAALMPFWRERGHHAEALTRCAVLLDSPDTQADVHLRTRVQLNLGMLAHELGDAAQVQAWGEAALAGARTTGQRAHEANAYAVLAHAAVLRGDAVSRRACYSACLPIYRELGDARSIAEGLNNLASCWCEDNQPQHAQPLLHEALPLAQASGHKWLEAAILHTLSEVDCALGDFVGARRHLEDSMVLRRGLQHKFHLVLGLQALAMVALRLGDDDSAAVELREALSLCASHDFAGMVAPCLVTAAAWAAAQRRGADAALLLGSVDTALREHTHPLAPTDRELQDIASTQSQALLGAAAWQRHWQQGRALSGQAALQRALAVLDGSDC